MAYDSVRFQLLKAPEASKDGSYIVKHDVAAQARNGDGEWVVVPAQHKDILVPADELQTAIALGAVAYKQALVDNLATPSIPITSWATAAILEKMNNNVASSGAAAAANEFITETLGLSYPVSFSI